MASPTEAELDAQLQNAVALLDNFRTGQTVAADLDAYIQSLESDFATDQAGGAQAVRDRAALTAGSYADVLTPWLIAYAHHVVNKPERDVNVAFERVYQYWVDNTKTVKTRAFTFGTISGWTGTGDGTLERLTVDENGFTLEAQYPDTKAFECLEDAQLGGADRHEELFEIAGQAAALDFLEIRGSGLTGTIQAVSSNDSLFANPSFSSFSIAGDFVSGLYAMVDGDTVTSWATPLSTDVTNITLDQTRFSHDPVGDTTPTSLRITGDVTLTQNFSDNAISLDRGTPYGTELWVYVEGAVSAGTISFKRGSKTLGPITLTTLTGDAWNRIAFTKDKDLWPINFNENDATAVITISGLTGGNINLDEARFHELTPFDGSWWEISSGLTKFLTGAKQSVADSAVGAKIQEGLWAAFGRSFPSSGTPSLADPA